MDVVAFALLGIGTLLVLLGIVFNFVDNRQNQSTQKAAPPPQQQQQQQQPSAIFNSPNYGSPSNYYPPAPPMPSQTPPPTPMQTPYDSSFNREPASATFRMQEQARTPQTPKPVVDVMVGRENPKLFQKKSFLYVDQSRTNVYTDGGAIFSLEDVSGIKRVGEGIFSYDGFTFMFNTQSGNYRYAVENLNHIAFYPNCVVLVPRDEEYPALLFSDETESIRRALETFKIES